MHMRAYGCLSENGVWLPLQYAFRKKVQLLNGAWVWRKGGTQKKDGFWASIRRHFSRRAVPTGRMGILRHMAYFHQWLYWRSSDPISDAQCGRHCGPGCTDMLSALRALRRRLVALIGLDQLERAGAGWYEEYKWAFLDTLPEASNRVSQKQSPMQQ